MLLLSLSTVYQAASMVTVFLNFLQRRVVLFTINVINSPNLHMSP